MDSEWSCHTDYFLYFLLLLFLDHPNLEPRHFVDEKVVNENHKDFMFLECILFITEVRTGRFVLRGSSLDIRYLALAVVFSSSFACLFALMELCG